MTGGHSDRLSRRAFVRASLGVGIGAGTAGCGESGTVSQSSPSPTETPTETPPPRLELENVRFVAEQPTGYREYEPVPEKTYELGQTAWIYFEPSVVQTGNVDGVENSIWIRIREAFLDGLRQEVDRELRSVMRPIESEEALDELFLWAATPIPTDAAPGTWWAEIEVTDAIGRSGVSETLRFDVEAGDHELDTLLQFKLALAEEASVAWNRFEREGETVELAVRSFEMVGSAEWEREILEIARIFARFVADGWDVDRLSVEMRSNGGVTATWHVDRPDALAFGRGTIDRATFEERVLETVSME